MAKNMFFLQSWGSKNAILLGFLHGFSKPGVNPMPSFWVQNKKSRPIFCDLGDDSMAQGTFEDPDSSDEVLWNTDVIGYCISHFIPTIYI